MEENIKILESYIEKINEGYCKDCNELCNMYGVPAEPPIRIAEAIQNLIARNKELEKHYEHEQEYINGEVFSAKQMHFIDDEYIPKSKVKEKIEEIERDKKKLYKIQGVEDIKIYSCIDVIRAEVLRLEELLD